MPKKHTDHFSIHGIKIATNNLQRWLVLVRSDQQNFIDLSNSSADMNLQLAVAVRLALRVGMLLFQTLKSHADIVPVFFEHGPDGNQVICFEGATHFRKLSIPQFFQQFGPAHRVRFVIESRLEFSKLVSRCAYYAKNHSRAQPNLTGHTPDDHSATFYAPACGEGLCCAPAPARPGRHFGPGPGSKISGKRPGRALAGSAYRSRARE